MLTPWGEKLDKNNVLPEYPRPQMRRGSFINLNGEWDYAFTAAGEKQPEKWQGKILVPFSPESELSGVGRRLMPDEYLWYRRDWVRPEDMSGRVILHFGAVDQSCTVYINGLRAYRHRGGYLPFEFDATGFLSKEVNELTLSVRDVSDTSFHSRGKQSSSRGGIWYTPQSGIWQTVWAECIPKDCVKKLRITPNYDGAYVEVSADTVGESKASAIFDGQLYPLPAKIPVPDFEPWTPENPRLYEFSVVCGEDKVYSYFAMRKFSVEEDEKGVKRLFLNNEPLFHNGLLDQGYWPDGLYTAPTDEALAYDIRVAKSMGYNMLRKHIKVEPLRWYYHCDRLGMLVWQDMPCGGGSYNPVVVSAPLLTGSHMKDSAYGMFGRGDTAGRSEFKAELAEMVKHLYNCPCIAMWVIFNEGWGQFDAEKMHDFVRSMDDTRTIDHASGWHDQHIGQVRSDHVYFKKYSFKPDKYGRAVLLSEFGGYAHKVIGHCFSKKDFGYKKFEMPAQLEIGLEELYQQQIRPAVDQGLAAAVYTQISDVEEEVNGLLTYDRKVAKIAPEIMQKITKVV